MWCLTNHCMLCQVHFLYLLWLKPIAICSLAWRWQEIWIIVIRHSSCCKKIQLSWWISIFKKKLWVFCFLFFLPLTAVGAWECESRNELSKKWGSFLSMTTLVLFSVQKKWSGFCHSKSCWHLQVFLGHSQVLLDKHFRVCFFLILRNAQEFTFCT